MSHVETKLRKLEEQVATAYKNFSIVGEVCTLREVPSDIRQGKFTQFASNILIEKAHIVDPAHFLILSEIGTSVARDEMNFLVKRLSQLMPKNTVDEISLGSIKQIIESMRNNDHLPSHIFMPIEYHDKLLDWNLEQRQQYRVTTNIFNTMHIDPQTSLKVTFSNKYIPFDEVIITSRDVNIWEYRPNGDETGRLTVKFEWNTHSLDAKLLVETVFNHEIISKEGNYVLTKTINPTTT